MRQKRADRSGGETLSFRVPATAIVRLSALAAERGVKRSVIARAKLLKALKVDGRRK